MLVVWRQIFFCSLENVRIFANRNGKMAERSNAAVLKTVDLHGSGGSNPSLSARKREKPSDLLDFSLLFFKGLWTGDVGSLYGIPNQCRPLSFTAAPILQCRPYPLSKHGHIQWQICDITRTIDVAWAKHNTLPYLVGEVLPEILFMRQLIS